VGREGVAGGAKPYGIEKCRISRKKKGKTSASISRMSSLKMISGVVRKIPSREGNEGKVGKVVRVGWGW